MPRTLDRNISSWYYFLAFLSRKGIKIIAGDEEIDRTVS